jgi:thiol-disulfide isomerase/thioredoxin
MIGGKLTPDDIVQLGDRFYLTVDPQQRYVHNGVFVVSVDWCKYCKRLEDVLAQAMSVAAFDVFYLIADENIASRWKAKDLGAKTYPTLFKVNADGSLTPYSGPRDVPDIVENFAI